MYEKFSTKLLKDMREDLIADLHDPAYEVDWEAIHTSLHNLDEVLFSRQTTSCRHCDSSPELIHSVCIMLYGEAI